MVLNLGSDLETVLIQVASRQGITAEELAIKALKDRFVRPLIQPRDDWERLLLEAGSDCGVSLSDEAVSSEWIYD
ncbi:MAG: hypothetical protein WCJ35_16335 [Planctomycetota bacterium]